MRHPTTAQTESKNACSNSSSYMLAPQSCLPEQMFAQMNVHLRVATKITLLVDVKTSCLASASHSRYSHVIGNSYLLLDTDCWKSHCRPEDLGLQILALTLQGGGSSEQVLHDVRWRGAGGLLSLVGGDAGCMLQQMHLLMQHTPHICVSSMFQIQKRCPLTMQGLSFGRRVYISWQPSGQALYTRPITANLYVCHAHVYPNHQAFGQVQGCCCDTALTALRQHTLLVLLSSIGW